jgi:hypothetical protein
MTCEHIDYPTSGQPLDSCKYCNSYSQHSKPRRPRLLNEPYPGGDPYDLTTPDENMEQLASSVRRLAPLVERLERSQHQPRPPRKPASSRLSQRALTPKDKGMVNPELPSPMEAARELQERYLDPPPERFRTSDPLRLGGKEESND